MSPRPDLTVVVISHGHEAMLPTCLGSLGPALAGLSAEVVVVDNLPGGAARAALGGPLPALAPEPRLVESARPVGFAANANRGAAAGSGRHVLLLNPDTRHRAGRLADAVALLDARPDLGLVGCALENPDGTPQRGHRRFPSPAFVLARGFGADRWPWRPAFYARGLMEDAGPPADSTGGAPFPVDWVFGAFMLLRRADWEALGGMDEGYRLYYEDVDLARRLRDARGLGACVLPALRFAHAHGRASAKAPFGRAWRWHVASAARYFLKSGLSSVQPWGRQPRRGLPAQSTAAAGYRRQC